MIFFLKKNDSLSHRCPRVTGTSENLNNKINSIKEVITRDIYKDDHESLKWKLMAAIEEKKRVLESHLHNLKAKYGLSKEKSDDVVLDATPSPRCHYNERKWSSPWKAVKAPRRRSQNQALHQRSGKHKGSLVLKPPIDSQSYA